MTEIRQLESEITSGLAELRRCCVGKWELVSVSEVTNILDNKRVPITASERRSGKYPYYGANGVQDYIDNFIFDDELVLLAEDGGNFGSATSYSV